MVAIQGRVDPTPVRPPRLGLLASANNVVTGNDYDDSSRVNEPISSQTQDYERADAIPVHEGQPAANVERPARGAPVRWVLGFSYIPEHCDASDRIDLHGAVEGTPPANPVAADVINVVPYIVEGIDKYSTFGTPQEGEYAERREYATRQLLACEGKQIEAELWGGALTRASANMDNRYLADSHCVLPEGDRLLGYLTALAVLEHAIQAGSCSQQGMIHARADTISLWDAGGALRRVGDLILTIHDTIVVPGRGYDGSAPISAVGEDPAHFGVVPSSDSAWAYATTIVDVRRGALVSPQTMLERTDHSTNVLTTYARRPAAATWGCLQVGVHVDHINSVSTTGS